MRNSCSGSRPSLAVFLGLALLWLQPASAAERGPGWQHRTGLWGVAARAQAQMQAPVQAQVEDASQARVIVKYKAQSTLMQPAFGGRGLPAPQHALALGKRLSLPLSDGRILGDRTQGLRGVGLSSTQLAKRLAAQADVEWAVPDQRRHWKSTTNDPYFAAGQTGNWPAVGQWYLRTPDATAPAAINAVAAWDTTRGSASVTVAVLDTGVRFDHPDLASKLWPGYDFIADRVTANDGGARDSDASDPGDWTTANQCDAGEPAADSSWHGTQVAGLIGAVSNNNQGMAGVGGAVMVLPVRVLGRCGGYDSDIIAGMLWAAGVSRTPTTNPHPAKVLNLSLGSQGACTTAYADAVKQVTAAGVTVVAAAGNDTGLAVGAPANCAGVIAVAGVRHIGTKVGYSSIGPQVAVAAPAGNCVNEAGACLYPLLTTINTGRTSPGTNTYSDSINPTLGTSFSSPLVAGAAALMLSANPALTPAQIKSMLQTTARPFPTSGADVGTRACAAPSAAEQLECYCTTSTCGAGMLDARAAVAKAKGISVIAATDSDRVFNYLEAVYPQYVSPAGAVSTTGSGYYYRYYASTNAYVGTMNGNVYYLVPAINDQINLLGSIADWLAIAAAAGY